jgi:hypothetical protein
MDKNSKWQYILLGAGAFLVVIVIVYFRVSTDYHISLSSLVPSLSFIQTLPFVSSRPGVKPTSVEGFTTSRGVKWYTVKGKFVTLPVYDTNNVLTSNFVIDGDPDGHRIPVTMTQLSGKVYVERFQGSLNGEAVWNLEDTESLQRSIKVNAPALLRLQPIMEKLAPYDLLVEKVMDGIIAGNWSIPDNFSLSTRMVGVVE